MDLAKVTSIADLFSGWRPAIGAATPATSQSGAAAVPRSVCGEGVHYSRENGQTVPIYVCQETAVRRAGKTCQTVPGKVVDPAITALLIEMMTPMTLAVSLEVQRELEARAAETDALRHQHVERLRYEAELTRRRYMKVDPDNRLVADALEAEWNDKCAPVRRRDARRVRGFPAG